MSALPAARPGSRLSRTSVKSESSDTAGSSARGQAHVQAHVHVQAERNRCVTLPYPPSVNRYWRRVGARTVLSREGRAYKAAVAVAWMRERVARCASAGAGASASGGAAVPALPLLAGAVAVRLEVYRPRRQGDLDNVAKAVLDALNGLAWLDDSQIVELHLRRHEDAVSPRVEVYVWPAVVPG